MQKSYIPYFQTVILQISFLVVAVSIRENTWIEIFFIKFEDNIEKFEAGGRELFNIIQEFNEKNRNPSVFSDGNSNNKERNL